jgi:hypothetical protein
LCQYAIQYGQEESSPSRFYQDDVSVMNPRDILGTLPMSEAMTFIPPGNYDTGDGRCRESFLSLVDRQPVEIKRMIKDARRRRDESQSGKKRKRQASEEEKNAKKRKNYESLLSYSLK